MSSRTARKATGGQATYRYERRRPEQAVFHQLVAEHYPLFLELLADQGRSLPDYVRREFDEFIKCGIPEHGFLRVRCQDWHSECLVALCCKRRDKAIAHSPNAPTIARAVPLDACVKVLPSEACGND